MLFNKNKLNWMLISLALFIPTAYALDDDPDAIANIMTLYPVTSPNESIAAPVAFGAQTGDVFGSFSFSTADITDAGETSSISAGFGLGDPDKALGLTTVLSITTTPSPFHTGGLSFQLSHNFNSLTALAAGVQNVLPWGSNNVYS